MADMKTCQYCGKDVVPQGLKNHEKNCIENPDNKKVEEIAEPMIEEVTPEVEVELPTLPVVADLKVEVAEVEVPKLVEVVTNQELRSYIGDRYYTFYKGVPQEVTQNVKDILKRAGMLGAI